MASLLMDDQLSVTLLHGCQPVSMQVLKDVSFFFFFFLRGEIRQLEALAEGVRVIAKEVETHRLKKTEV